MRIMLVGGAGFIGSHLTAHLLGLGVEVGVIDLHPSSPGLNERLDDSWKISMRNNLRVGASQFQCDVNDGAALQASMCRFDPECILYLAALPLVAAAEKHFTTAGDSMIRGLANALEAARKSLPARFVYVSSSMVYGNFLSEPMREDAPTEPINLYGGFKLAGEVLTRAYLSNTQIQSVVVRPSGVYGPTDLHGRVVQKFCEAALRNETITVTSGHDTYIDFTWVEDLVDGLARAAMKPAAAGQTFNLAYGRARNLDELVEIVRRHVPHIDVVRSELTEAIRPRRGSLDVSKARNLLGFQAGVDLETGIDRYFQVLERGRDAGPQLLAARAC